MTSTRINDLKATHSEAWVTNVVSVQPLSTIGVLKIRLLG